SGRVEIRKEPGSANPLTGGETRTYPITGGVAKIPNLRRGEKLLVTVVADGEQSLGGELVVEDGARMALTDEATIKGRAVFPEGAAAGNEALVAKIYRANQEPELVEFHTNADGSFAI